jgi:hypothetical protein
MAIYYEAKILDGLLSHLSDLEMLEIVGDIPFSDAAKFSDVAGFATYSPTAAASFAWQNVDSDPTSTGYLRVFHIPAPTEKESLGDNGMNRHSGLLQVSVLWPESAGIITPTERAGAVVSHFKVGTVIAADDVFVRIIRPPSIAPALQVPPYLHLPVTIRYIADTPNPS